MSKHTTLNNFNVTKEIGVFGQLIVPRYMLSYSDPTRNNFSGNQQVLPLKNNVWLQEVYPKIVDETLSRIAVGDRSRIWYFTPFRDEGLPVRETSDIKLILRNEIAGTLSSDYSPYCNTCQDMCCAPRKSTSIYYYIGNDANPVVKEGYTDFYVELRQIEIEKELESGEVRKEWSEKLYIVLKKLGETEEDDPKYYCILDKDFAFTEDYEVKVKPEDDEILLSKFVTNEESSEETNIDFYAWFSGEGDKSTEDVLIPNGSFSVYDKDGNAIILDPKYIYTLKKFIKYDGEEMELPNSRYFPEIYTTTNSIYSLYIKFSIHPMYNVSYNKMLINKSLAPVFTGYVTTDKTSKTITSSAPLYDEDGNQINISNLDHANQRIIVLYYYLNGTKYNNIVDNSLTIGCYTEVNPVSLRVQSSITIDKIEYTIQPYLS